jgi:hypothetical protein
VNGKWLMPILPGPQSRSWCLLVCDVTHRCIDVVSGIKIADKDMPFIEVVSGKLVFCIDQKFIV